MFRFTIRDLLWLMVVVGLALAFAAERYRSAGLRSELAESANTVWACEENFIELARIWKACDPEMVTFRDDRIEITTGDNSYREFSLSNHEMRIVREYQDVPYPLHFK